MRTVVDIVHYSKQEPIESVTKTTKQTRSLGLGVVTTFKSALYKLVHFLSLYTVGWVFNVWFNDFVSH